MLGFPLLWWPWFKLLSTPPCTPASTQHTHPCSELGPGTTTVQLPLKAVRAEWQEWGENNCPCALGQGGTAGSAACYAVAHTFCCPGPGLAHNRVSGTEWPLGPEKWKKGSWLTNMVCLPLRCSVCRRQPQKDLEPQWIPFFSTHLNVSRNTKQEKNSSTHHLTPHQPNKSSIFIFARFPPVCIIIGRYTHTHTQIYSSGNEQITSSEVRQTQILILSLYLNKCMA